MMVLGSDADAQRVEFRVAFEEADLALEEVWLSYFAMGGMAGPFEIDAYIHGAMTLPALQRDILSHSLNETLDELGSPAARAPYSREEAASVSRPEGSPRESRPPGDNRGESGRGPRDPGRTHGRDRRKHGRDN
jgi:hypothetical protein